jgi:predicted Zn-dependent peptidase
MTTLTPPATGYPRTLPDLTTPRRGRRPAVAERVLPSGLRVLVVRRPSVPLVEVRLRIPFQPAGGQRGTAHLTRASVLSQTMLSGTADMSTVDIAAALQEVGGGLAVGVDPDRLLVSGNSLSTGLPRLLEVLAGVLTGATYPSGEVNAERDRLADRIEMAASQPAHAARKALLRRLYGTHPYAVQTPEPEEVRAVRPPALRTLHANRVRPDGALLVLVGDVSPARTLDAVEAALSGWNGTADLAALRPAADPVAGPLLLVDRPGSVQSSLRMGLGAIGRAEPQYAALQLANLVFGGYFSSRLVENIREDKGYTYSPHSSITHWQAGSVTVVDADVATEVTAPALLEMGYELGRIAALPPRQDELDQARQYAVGTLQLSIASQGGLAATLMTLAAAGLDLDWLYEQPVRLGKVTVEDVHAAAERYLAPSRAVTVVLGDASAVAEPLAALGPVEEA